MFTKMRIALQRSLLIFIGAIGFTSCDKTYERPSAIQSEITILLNQRKAQIQKLSLQINNFNSTSARLLSIIKIVKEYESPDKTQEIAKLKTVVKNLPDVIDFEASLSPSRFVGSTLSTQQSRFLNTIREIDRKNEIRRLLLKNDITLQYVEDDFGTTLLSGSERNYIPSTDYELNSIVSASYRKSFTNTSSIPVGYLDQFRANRLIEELQNFEIEKETFIANLQSNQAQLASRLSDINNEIEENRKYITLLEEDLDSLKKSGTDRILIQWALPIFGAILVVMISIPGFYRSRKTQKIIFQNGLLLQLITVFLLTVTILLLGIGDKIKSEVLGTLLGGISVYVLQQSSKSLFGKGDQQDKVDGNALPNSNTGTPVVK